MTLLHFVETTAFQRRIDALLSREEYRVLQEYLRFWPDAGALISGTGGCRKVRWAIQGKGKRGGIRAIYYYLADAGEIYLLQACAKNEQDDLTDEQRNVLRKYIAILENA